MKIETQKIELKELNATGICSYINQELCTVNIRHYLTEDIAISFILYSSGGMVLFTDINGEQCTVNNFYTISKKYKNKYVTMKDYIGGKEFKEIIKEFFGHGITINIICPYINFSAYMQTYID